MKKCSTLTFGEITENLAYIKVIWNGQCIYDDECGNETFEHLKQIKKDYRDKVIDEMNIKMVQFHHCILNIKGEE